MFLLATTNAHKIDEIRKILPDFPFEGVSTFLEEWHIEETGGTFEENALLKAEKAAVYFGMIAIADDSGLEVKALDSFPGVQSARFMINALYEEKMRYILDRMVPYQSQGERAARFRTVVAFFDPLRNRKECFEGIVEGSLSFSIKGNRGFGYDPIFIPNGFENTFGELPEEIKNSFSHRARAFKKLHSWMSKNKYLDWMI